MWIIEHSLTRHRYKSNRKFKAANTYPGMKKLWVLPLLLKWNASTRRVTHSIFQTPGRREGIWELRLLSSEITSNMDFSIQGSGIQLLRHRISYSAKCNTALNLIFSNVCCSLPVLLFVHDLEVIILFSRQFLFYVSSGWNHCSRFQVGLTHCHRCLNLFVSLWNKNPKERKLLILWKSRHFFCLPILNLSAVWKF